MTLLPSQDSLTVTVNLLSYHVLAAYYFTEQYKPGLPQQAISNISVLLTCM